MDTEICGVCGDPKAAHGPGEKRHEFTLTHELKPAPRPHVPNMSVTDNRTKLPADPVLRLALIRAGVVRPEQLEAVEEELRHSGIATG